MKYNKITTKTKSHHNILDENNIDHTIPNKL